MLEDFVGTRGRKHALITLQVARLDIIFWCLPFRRSLLCNLSFRKEANYNKKSRGVKNFKKRW